jgi:hypothetical protein
MNTKVSKIVSRTGAAAFLANLKKRQREAPHSQTQAIPVGAMSILATTLDRLTMTVIAMWLNAIF